MDMKATLPAVTPTAKADAKHACFQSTPSLIKPSVNGFISASFGTINRAPNPSIKINVDVDVHDATTSSLLGITKDEVEASLIALSFSSRNSLFLFSTTSLYVSLFTFRFFGFCNLMELLLLLLLLSIFVALVASIVAVSSFVSSSLSVVVVVVVVVVSLSIFLLSFLFMGFDDDDDDDEARTLPALVLPLLRSGAAAAAAAAAGGGGGRIVVKPGLIVCVNIYFFSLDFSRARSLRKK
jgi:hypothetical protein